jgi:hypothetical protein
MSQPGRPQMNTDRNSPLRIVALLLLVLIVSGCSTLLPPPPAPVRPVQVPPPPAELMQPPQPSESWSENVRKLYQKWLKLLGPSQPV